MRAETALNRPSGAPIGPSGLRPQQATVPSERSAHECAEPAVIESKNPSGALRAAAGFVPQHSIVPPARRPHECCLPTLTAANSPRGARVCL